MYAPWLYLASKYMFVFIDAYNVLKTMKGVDYVLPRESESFIQRAQRRAQLRSYHITIVFDAGDGYRPTTHQKSHMAIVYSGLQQNADDMLIQLIERSSGHEKLLVTADRSLRKRGLACGAQPVDPITYWRAIHKEGADDAFSLHNAEVPLDFDLKYSVEELKAMAFSHIGCPKTEDGCSGARDSAAHKKSKAIKKFEKIKDKL